VVLLTGLAEGRALAAAQALSTGPTFSKDVAPILWRRCGECHRPNGAAPFSLISYDEVRPRATLIAAATRSRYMPPWKPEPGHGEFVRSRRLTDLEIDLIARWVEAGAAEGDRGALPPPPQWVDGWRGGTPDLVLSLPEYVVPATNATDIFRNFVVDVPFVGTRYVRGFEFRPGNTSIHHANVFVDSTQASRSLDAEDPSPGYQGLIPHSAVFPDGHFLGWTPGQAAPLEPDRLSWQLDGGSSLLVQVHLRSTGKPEHIRPSIGLFFAATPPTERPLVLRLGRQNLDIPPGEKEYRVLDEFVLPVDADVHAVQAHSHFRARDVRAWAELPGGSLLPMLWIPRWDFNWQDQYQYVKPLSLPRGTRIILEYVFDNSAENPRNPESPPTRAVWGFRSADEMGDLWVQLTTRSDRDRQVLARDATRKMTAETIVGYEAQIRVNPDYVATRNDVALIYMQTERPDLALPHFLHVVSIEPQSPAAHFNLGTALQATGKEDQAIGHYEEALRLNPGYARARERLAASFYNRAYILDRQKRPADAIAALRRAIEIRADWPPALGQLAWLLATTTARSSDPDEPVRLASRAAELTARTDAGILDSLAAAYAAAGRMSDAIRTAEEAEARAIKSAPETVDDIRARLRLYRSGRSLRP
jgi:Flp pilus assembly protein TadD